MSNTTTIEKVRLFESTLISLIEKDGKASFAKLWRKAAYRCFNTVVSDNILSTVAKFGKDNILSFLQEVEVRIDSQGITNAYKSIGVSCMLGKDVGPFYEIAGLSCICSGMSRCIIDEKTCSFTKVYGEHHMVLESLLLSIGFKVDDGFLHALNLEKIRLNYVRSFSPVDLLSKLDKDITDNLSNVYRESIVNALGICPEVPSAVSVLEIIKNNVDPLFDYLSSVEVVNPDTESEQLFIYENVNDKYLEKIISTLLSFKVYIPYLDFTPVTLIHEEEEIPF